MTADLSRRVPFEPRDPQAGITLGDLAEFVALCMGPAHELPAETPVRAAGMIEFDFAGGPRIARITADPTKLTEAS